MLLLISKDGTGTFTTPTDWTQLANAGSSAQAVGIFYRQLTGSLSNFSISHASEMTAWLCLRIPNGDVPQISSAATGSSTTPSPPSLTHSFGSGAEVMWLAFCGWDYNRTCSAYPSTFTADRYTANSTETGGSGVAMATLESTTNPQDPGTFTISSTDTWQAYTLAIRLDPDQTITAVGNIATAEAFGSATIVRGQVTIAPTGVPSAEAFGSAEVKIGPSTISPVGITSAEIFGTAIIHGGVHTYSQMVSVLREPGRRTQTEGGYRVPTERQGGVATETVKRVSETKYSGVIR